MTEALAHFGIAGASGLFVIEGGGASGKSWILRAFVAELARAQQGGEGKQDGAPDALSSMVIKMKGLGDKRISLNTSVVQDVHTAVQLLHQYLDDLGAQASRV